MISIVYFVTSILQSNKMDRDVYIAGQIIMAAFQLSEWGVI